MQGSSFGSHSCFQVPCCGTHLPGHQVYAHQLPACHLDSGESPIATIYLYNFKLAPYLYFSVTLEYRMLSDQLYYPVSRFNLAVSGTVSCPLLKF